jgi:hypothetical protein
LRNNGRLVLLLLKLMIATRIQQEITRELSKIDTCIPV